MKLTAELSLYPFAEQYIPIIKTFVEAAARYDNIRVITNAMSTQVCGEWDDVFTLVSQELHASYERYGRQVLVCKFIPGELPIR